MLVHHHPYSSIYQCFMFNHSYKHQFHPITATCQHVPVPSPWCWTFPAVAIGRAPQRRRAAKAAQPVPPAPAWMTTTSPWTTRPKSMAAAKVLGAQQTTQQTTFPSWSRYPSLIMWPTQLTSLPNMLGKETYRKLKRENIFKLL